LSVENILTVAPQGDLQEKEIGKNESARAAEASNNRRRKKKNQADSTFPSNGLFRSKN